MAYKKSDIATRRQQLADKIGTSVDLLDELIQKNSERLPWRGEAILRAYFGIVMDSFKDGKELGAEFEISHARVMQIKDLSIRILRYVHNMSGDLPAEVRDYPLEVFFDLRADAAGVKKNKLGRLLNALKDPWTDDPLTVRVFLDTFTLRKLRRQPNLGKIGVEAIIRILATENFVLRDEQKGNV